MIVTAKRRVYPKIHAGQVCLVTSDASPAGINAFRLDGVLGVAKTELIPGGGVRIWYEREEGIVLMPDEMAVRFEIIGRAKGTWMFTN